MHASQSDCLPHCRHWRSFPAELPPTVKQSCVWGVRWERREGGGEGVRKRGGGEEGRRGEGEENERRRSKEDEKRKRGREGRGGGLKLFTLRHGGYTIEWSYEWLSECSFSCRGRSVGETHSALPHAAASALMSDRLWTPAQLITATQSHLQDPPTKRV